MAARPVLQWMAAAVGLAVTLAAGGVILTEALQIQRPASISARIESERRTEDGRIVQVLVSNTGSETAAAVEVSGRIGGETAAATIDYVPGDGSASAALVFPSHAQGEAAVSVIGWTDP